MHTLADRVSRILDLGALLTSKRRLDFARRNLNRVGEGCTFAGLPFISNDGRIEIGSWSCVSSTPIRTHFVAEQGGEILIGNNVYIGHGSGFACRSKVTIGAETSFGPFSMLMDTDYHVVGDSEAKAPTGPIVVGQNVRIGSHVTILRDSTIGDGATIQSGSVVSGNVAAGATVAGVPARTVGSRHVDAASHLDATTVEDQVTDIARRAFRLSELPQLSYGPKDIPGWDSLGSLSLLITLEEEFQVPLNETHLVGIKCLRDIAQMVKSELDRYGISR